MKRIFLTACLFILQNAWSQQPLVTFDMCKTYYNPAFTAYEGSANAYLAGAYKYRYYLPAGTNSRYFNAGSYSAYIMDISAPIFIRRQHKFGIGLNYSSMKDRNELMNDRRLNLAYRIESGNRVVSVGVNMDMINHYTDLTYLPFRYADPSIPSKLSHHIFNIGLGLVYHHKPTNFYAGFSGNQLLPHNFKLQNYSPVFTDNAYVSFMTGIDIKLNSRLVLKPSLLCQTQTCGYVVPVLVAEFKEHYSLGVTYNSRMDERGIRMGYRSGPFRIDYSYTIIPVLYRVEPGRHTAVLSYRFPKQKPYDPSIERFLPVAN